MPTGAIIWRDLTVQDADHLQKFYSKVIGWQATPHTMEGYSDYDIVIPETGETIAGICHARGSNANIPAQWLMYVQVENLHTSVEQCLLLNGRVIDGPRMMGGHNFCVIQDPAGAVLGLIETASTTS